MFNSLSWSRSKTTDRDRSKGRRNKPRPNSFPILGVDEYADLSIQESDYVAKIVLRFTEQGKQETIQSLIVQATLPTASRTAGVACDAGSR